MNIFRNSHYFKKFIKNEKYRKRKKIYYINNLFIKFYLIEFIKYKINLKIIIISSQ